MASCQQKTPVAWALRTVSLCWVAEMWLAANMTYGGSKVRLLNWEKGARLAGGSDGLDELEALEVLEGWMVGIQPMGRGRTHACPQLDLL